jgi:hypothetical protein
VAEIPEEVCAEDECTLENKENVKLS